MSARRRRGSGLILAVIATLWGGAVVAGNVLLFEYALHPGKPADRIEQWPVESRVPLDPNRPTLLMVAHPQCSCTRASIGELARLMSRLHGEVTAQVLFIAPTGTREAWSKTDLWSSAARIPGVSVRRDQGGVEAARFGAKTSGQTYLYNPQGRRLFAGGITPTRSHYGDSVGRRRIISLVTQHEVDRDESAVFGCPLDELEADEMAGKSVLQKLEFALGREVQGTARR